MITIHTPGDWHTMSNVNKKTRSEQDKRYAPDSVMIIARGMQPVVSYILHPPQHKINAIDKDLHCLECKTAHCSRFFGVDGGEINSELRMVVWGGFINPRNELANTWEPCTTT